MTEKAEQSIAISDKTFQQVKNRLGHTEFNSVDEYTEYVLDELTLYISEQSEVGDTEDVDEDEVKERLQSLGYLRG